MSDELQAIAKHLRQARRVLFITGAGLSAESGLPTYRGIGGLYNQDLTEDGVRIEDAISGLMLASRPDITWKYLAQIESSCRRAGFNRGHQIIADIERTKPESWVLTQNIDGFHSAAGTRNLIEIHGRFSDLACTACDHAATVANYGELEKIPPHCPRCGALVRPGVVLFGEMLPETAVATLVREMEQGFDMVFSIGTTSQFPYIARPVMLAPMWNAVSVEINPGETPVSGMVNYKISSGALETLEALWQAI
jgi:NAD-dependent deacetylase